MFYARHNKPVATKSNAIFIGCRVMEWTSNLQLVAKFVPVWTSNCLPVLLFIWKEFMDNQYKK